MTRRRRNEIGSPTRQWKDEEEEEVEVEVEGDDDGCEKDGGISLCPN